MQPSTIPPHAQARPLSRAQTEALRRKHPNRVLDRYNRVRPREDRRWRRDDAKGGRPRMSTSALIDALQFWWLRRGAAWGPKDTELQAEVKARCWHVAQLATLRVEGTPPWLRGLLPGRVASGCTAFVVGVLTAHRCGAAGVLASYAELGAHYGVATRTVQRWVKRLEGDGVLEVLKTWRPKPGTDARGYGKHVYRPGPALAREAGLGILEGAPELSETTRQRATWHARRARRRHRARTRTERDVRWRAREAARGKHASFHMCADCRNGCAHHAPAVAPSLSVDTLTTPSRPSGLGESAPSPPGPLTGATPRSVERPHAVVTSQASRDAPRPETSPAVPASSPPDREAASSVHVPGHLGADTWAELERLSGRLPGVTSGRNRAGPPTPPPRPEPRERRCGVCGGGGVVHPGWRVCSACGGGGRVLS